MSAINQSLRTRSARRARRPGRGRGGKLESSIQLNTMNTLFYNVEPAAVHTSCFTDHTEPRDLKHRTRDARCPEVTSTNYSPNFPDTSPSPKSELTDVVRAHTQKHTHGSKFTQDHRRARTASPRGSLAPLAQHLDRCYRRLDTHHARRALHSSGVSLVARLGGGGRWPARPQALLLRLPRSLPCPLHRLGMSCVGWRAG